MDLLNSLIIEGVICQKPIEWRREDGEICYEFKILTLHTKGDKTEVSIYHAEVESKSGEQ